MAVGFGGTTDYYRRGSDLVVPPGHANGKRGTFHARFRIAGGAGGARFLLSSENNGIAAQLTTANKFQVFGRNTADTFILLLTSGLTYAVGTVGRSLTASWDLSTATAHLYVDDTSDLAAGSTLTNDTLDYTKPTWSVGAASADGSTYVSFWNGDIDTIYFHEDYVDLSVEANRRKFVGDDGLWVGLGPEGFYPFETRPAIMLTGSAPSNFGRNFGFGGVFARVGAPTSRPALDSPGIVDTISNRLAGEKWARCDRCGFGFVVSDLTREPATGLRVCTTGPTCFSTDRDEMTRR